MSRSSAKKLDSVSNTQTVHMQAIRRRPHVQGDPRALQVEFTQEHSCLGECLAVGDAFGYGIGG